MAFLIDSVFDSGLATITSSATRLDINYGTEPTTYAEATSTKSCGNDTVSPGSPANGSPSGRAVTIPAITAGAVTATQTAAWWSLIRQRQRADRNRTAFCNPGSGQR